LYWIVSTQYLENYFAVLVLNLNHPDLCQLTSYDDSHEPLPPALLNFRADPSQVLT
jgi:Uma2 family endonuclease